jgi:hypothetical protein
LLATFAPTGPKQCSELDVVQYDSDKIIQLLGVDFKLIKTTNEAHPHPNQHNGDIVGGAKYTRANRPCVLVYQEQVKNRSIALKRECDIKSMTRDEKLTLLK